MTLATLAPARTMTGVLMMVGFCAVAPVMDTFAKLASEHVPSGISTLARFGIQAAVFLPLAALLGRLSRPGPRAAGLHLLRGGCLAVATLFYFAALVFMPVADAIAVFFVEPFILALLSALLLGERMGWRRLLACAAGFGGALLVIRPSFAAVGWPAAFPLASALFFAFYLILTRTMSRRMDALDLQAWGAVAGTAILALALVLLSDGPVPALHAAWPPAGALMLLAGIGLAASVSHLFITVAFRHAPPSVLGPLQYLEIVGATLLGLIVFGTFPDRLAWAGILIIVAAGLFVAWRERVAAIRLRTTGSAPPPQ